MVHTMKKTKQKNNLYCWWYQAMKWPGQSVSAKGSGQDQNSLTFDEKKTNIKKRQATKAPIDLWSTFVDINIISLPGYVSERIPCLSLKIGRPLSRKLPYKLWSCRKRGRRHEYLSLELPPSSRLGHSDERSFQNRENRRVGTIVHPIIIFKRAKVTGYWILERQDKTRISNFIIQLLLISNYDIIRRTRSILKK